MSVFRIRVIGYSLVALVGTLLLCVAAHADPRVDNMVARCQLVMGPGLCAVSNGSADFVQIPAMPGRPGGTFSTKDFKGLGYSQDPLTGLYEMCALIYRKCTDDWAGDTCMVARYRFKQTPP